MCLLIPCAAGLDMCVKNIGFKFQSFSHQHTASVILSPADSYLVWPLLKGTVQVRDPCHSVYKEITRELDFHDNLCIYIYTTATSGLMFYFGVLLLF